MYVGSDDNVETQRRTCGPGRVRRPVRKRAPDTPEPIRRGSPQFMLKPPELLGSRAVRRFVGQQRVATPPGHWLGVPRCARNCVSPNAGPTRTPILARTGRHDSSTPWGGCPTWPRGWTIEQVSSRDVIAPVAVCSAAGAVLCPRRTPPRGGQRKPETVLPTGLGCLLKRALQGLCPYPLAPHGMRRLARSPERWARSGLPNGTHAHRQFRPRRAFSESRHCARSVLCPFDALGC